VLPSRGIRSIGPSSAFLPFGHHPPPGTPCAKAQSNAAQSAPVWPPETILRAGFIGPYFNRQLPLLGNESAGDRGCWGATGQKTGLSNFQATSSRTSSGFLTGRNSPRLRGPLTKRKIKRTANRQPPTHNWKWLGEESNREGQPATT
jgi:hypothetical protein